MKREDLQIVVIEDLKYFWDNRDLRELYNDMIEIKLSAYGKVYGENVISSDKADFFGTHLIVCKKGLRLKPIFGYKSVTLSKCLEYHFKFPVVSLISNDGDKECLGELNRIIETSVSEGKSLSFDYSWAQDPSLKNVRSNELAEMLRDLAMVLAVNHHKDYEIDGMITCGGIKVKTDLFFDKMGFKKISEKSLFSQKDLNGDMAHVFHTEKYSDYAYKVANEYRDLWDNRLEFSMRKVNELKKAA